MSYDGRTAVGAPAQMRDLGELQITKIAVGQLDNNAYLLESRDGSVLLIDAAAEPQVILDQLPAGRLDAVVTTHGHRDHWGALAEVVAATGAQTFAGADEAASIGVPTDVGLRHGDTVTVGDQVLEVISLRGHTPDSIALAWCDTTGGWHVFTGDSLFPGGVGRTTAETFGQLFADVNERIFDRFGDDTWIYPGHGWDTTVGAERPALADWQARGW